MDNFKYQNNPQNDLTEPERNEADLGYSKNIDKNIYNDIYNKKSTPNQKFTFGVLLILAFGTLVYGFVSLSRNIYSSRNSFDSAAVDQQTEQSNLIDDLLTLQSMDTDKDGLNDYDELYIYKTSPYLPDTDSDGYLDKQEIDDGYDPLCPKGQDCRGTGEGGEVNIIEPEVVPPPEGGELSQDLIDELSNLTPEQIRQLLLESGEMTQEEIDQIDDATLMSIYQEVLNQ